MNGTGDLSLQAPDTVSTKDGPAQKLAACIAILRPRQWTKNLIAYAPLIFALKLQDLHLFEKASLCVLAFCLVSSATYIVNDLRDLEADKMHPRKKRRPLASGQISVQSALILAAILAPAGLLISFLVKPSLALLTLTYLCLTVFYTFVLKNIAILDVLAIASGFLLRAISGALAVSVPTSAWFLLCTGLGAVFLGLEKRRRELGVLTQAADTHRKTLQIYTPALLDRMESLVLPSLLTAYVFYSFQSVHGEWMMLTVPFVLYGLMRYQQLSTAEDDLSGTPEEVLLKDRPIQITILLWLLTSIGVIYGGIQHGIDFIVNAVDSLILH